MIQSHERNIKPFRAASLIRQQQQTPATTGKYSMDATNIKDANKNNIAISSRNDRNDGNTNSRRDVISRRDVSNSRDTSEIPKMVETPVIERTQLQWVPHQRKRRMQRQGHLQRQK
jgi:hypothetical protein